jgi:hypothetical protein
MYTRPTHSQFRIARRRQRARGYLMLELGLTLVLSAILLISQLNDINKAIDESLMVATGQYMVAQQDGVNKYVLSNMAQLSVGGAVTGVANALQPTVAELVAKNYLPVGFSGTSPIGLQFRTVLATSNCPGLNCSVSGFATSTAGYRDGTGNVRIDLLATVVNTVGIDGAMSLPETPTLLTFQGGSTVANPGGNVSGTLAIRVGSSSGIASLLSQFYRLDGTTPLAGAMNANNNDISGVKDLGVTGSATIANLNVSGDAILSSTATPGAACAVSQAGMVRRNANQSGLVVCGNSVWQIVGNAVSGISDGAACTTNGQLGTSETGVGYVCNGSIWTMAQINAAAGEACAPNGRAATSTATRELLICTKGAYVKFANLVAKNVEISRQLVSDGATVTKPTCDTGGTAAYSFHLTQTVVDVGVVPPRQALYVTATDNGATWTVKIRLKDNNGGDFSATPYTITATMKLECSY